METRELQEGYYHLVRFIRSDCRLDIFGETFSALRRPNMNMLCLQSMSRLKAQGLLVQSRSKNTISTAMTHRTTLQHRWIYTGYIVAKFRVYDDVTIVSVHNVLALNNYIIATMNT